MGVLAINTTARASYWREGFPSFSACAQGLTSVIRLEIFWERKQNRTIPCAPMSEIVVLQFGEAANAVGSVFWGLQVWGLVFSFLR